MPVCIQTILLSRRLFFSLLSSELAQLTFPKEGGAPMSFCTVTTQVQAQICCEQYNAHDFVPTRPFLDIKAEVQIGALANRKDQICYTFAPE